MSSWKDDLFDETKDDRAKLARESALMHAHPLLYDFLAGSMDAQEGLQVPPGSIQIWMEDGRIKTCWKVKAKGIYGFVVLADNANLSQSLEECLMQQLIEWRRDGGKKKA